MKKGIKVFMHNETKLFLWKIVFEFNTTQQWML